MTAIESESIITFNEGEDTCEVYTASPRVNKLLSSRGLTPYKTDTMHGKPSGWHYHLHKSSILLKPATHIIRIGGRRMTAVTPSCTPSKQLRKEK